MFLYLESFYHMFLHLEGFSLPKHFYL